MREKDMIRSVIGEQMPDMEKIRKNILANSGQKSAKGLPVFRLAGAVAAVCVAIVVGTYFWWQSEEVPLEPSIAEESAKKIAIEDTRNRALESAPVMPKKAVVNEAELSVEEIVINQMKDSEDKIDGEVRQMTEEEKTEIWNLFLSRVRVPEGLSATHYETIYTREKGKREYTVLHDYSIGYQDHKQEKNVSIVMSKDFKPLRDYFVRPQDKYSQIGQTQVHIYDMGEGNELYIAIFSYQGMNFDVETSGI